MEILDGIKNSVYFWKLNKAIYGLKQSFRMWNNKINNVILKLNFIRSKKKKKKKKKNESYVYYKKDHKDNISCILSLYVDDIIISGKKSKN